MKRIYRCSNNSPTCSIYFIKISINHQIMQESGQGYKKQFTQWNTSAESVKSNSKNFINTI